MPYPDVKAPSYVETHDLWLVRVIEQDLPRIHKIQSEAGMDQTTVVKTYEEVKEAFISWETNYEKQGLPMYTIRQSLNGPIIGTYGLVKANEHKPYADEVEIAFARITTSKQGKGYATQARDLILDIGFNVLGSETIHACTINPTIKRNFEKVGFVNTGDYHDARFGIVPTSYKLEKAKFNEYIRNKHGYYAIYKKAPVIESPFYDHVSSIAQTLS